MLATLSNPNILLIGLAVQFACAVGVFFVGRWRLLFGFLALVPVFWAAPFILASGHCLACLDGVVLIPVSFLAVVFIAKVRASDQAQKERSGDVAP